jgi:N-acetylglucosamine kinase-like BadF-type ATPase
MNIKNKFRHSPKIILQSLKLNVDIKIQRTYNEGNKIIWRKSMSYVIGIDGGGTKTTCLFLEADRDTLPSTPKIVTGGGTNPHVIGFEETGVRLVSLLIAGMERYSISPSEVVSIGCCLAGIGRSEDEAEMARVLKNFFLKLNFSENYNLFIGSDSLAALKGALPPESDEGLLIIAGTGSNAIGIDQHRKIHCCGGWGHLLGDEGSGYYLSLKALSSVAKEADGRGPETLISPILLKKLQLEEPQELIRYIYKRRLEKHEIARLAQCVIEASDQKDEVAIRILKEAAEELVLHIESLFQKNFNETTPVTASGSIFTHSRVVKQHFIEGIQRKGLGMFVEPYGSPEYGAALLAKSLIGTRKGGAGDD